MKEAVKTFVKSPTSFLMAILLFVLLLLFTLRLTTKGNHTTDLDAEGEPVELTLQRP